MASRGWFSKRSCRLAAATAGVTTCSTWSSRRHNKAVGFVVRDVEFKGALH